MATMTLEKKRKNIDLPVDVLQRLSVLAASQGKSLKAFIEHLLVVKANSISVEVLENPSPSGDSFFEDAENMAARGAKVIMISGPVQQQLKYPVRWFPVESADQMYNAACSFFAEADAAILSAAVADFTPEQVADAKIKREKEGEMMLQRKT